MESGCGTWRVDAVMLTEKEGVALYFGMLYFEHTIIHLPCYVYNYMYVLMRDEKERRKKQARFFLSS